MSGVRIKICGITREEDAAVAAEHGVDAVGLMFAESPRRVSEAQAKRIVASLPPYVSAVGVFVNARRARIERIADQVGLSEVQLHGEETPGFVAALRFPRVVKALRVRDRQFIADVGAFQAAGVAGLLLDAFSRTARGGSGRRFDWDLVQGAQAGGALDDAPPLILAGGLTDRNVRSAIRRVRPWGVDVSSGVETSPGIKCAERIGRFVAAVRAATARLGGQ